MDWALVLDIYMSLYLRLRKYQLFPSKGEGLMDMGTFVTTADLRAPLAFEPLPNPPCNHQRTRGIGFLSSRWEPPGVQTVNPEEAWLQQ